MGSDFKARKLCHPSQLPDIAPKSGPEYLFFIVWDFKCDDGGRNAETVLKYGERIIFTEPAIYEGAGRFVEVAKILRTKYGSTLLDLVPTSQSKDYLYGDDRDGPATVRAARSAIFPGTGGQT